MIDLVTTYPNYAHLGHNAQIIEVNSEDYYGKGYQDILTRVPSIANARRYLGWEPKIDLVTALRNTLDYHLANPQEALESEMAE